MSESEKGENNDCDPRREVAAELASEKKPSAKDPLESACFGERVDRRDWPTSKTEASEKVGQKQGPRNRRFEPVLRRISGKFTRFLNHLAP
jgi:hypothetical protein